MKKNYIVLAMCFVFILPVVTESSACIFHGRMLKVAGRAVKVAGKVSVKPAKLVVKVRKNRVSNNRFLLVPGRRGFGYRR